MKIESERLFGIPYAICRIDPWSYNKKEIVKDIKSNYLKNPIRNKWRSKNYNIHHAYNDWENPDYIKSDYSQLIEVYKKIIPKCLFTCGVKETCGWKFDIANYNCMGEGGFMGPHNHSSKDFVGVHYIQFDPKQHESTSYINEHPFANYSDSIFPQRRSLMHHNLNTSCYSENWQLPVKEDDFCMTPGFVRHEAPMQPKCDKLRMAIIVNIEVSL